MKNWKVELFEVQGKAAVAVDVFGVMASNHDQALREAKAWLLARGRMVRSVAFKPTGNLIAYVLPLAQKR